MPTQWIDTTPGPWESWGPMPADPVERAARAVRWVESFCVVPKGHNAGKLFELATFQQDWIHDTWADGVSASVLSLGAGNGKSTLVAALVLWNLFDPLGVGYPEVPIVSTRVDQATRTCVRPMQRIVQASPELRHRCKIRTGVGVPPIEVPATGGVCYPVADHVDGLQGLDFTLAVCDELGFIGSDSWGALLGRLGKQPDQRVIGMGTVGYSAEGRALHAVLEAVERGDLDESVVVHMYSAPDGCGLWDRDAWEAANPGIAAGILGYRAAVTAAQLMSEAEVRVTRLNQYDEGRGSWLEDVGGEDGIGGARLLDAIDAGPGLLVPGAATWLGVDIGLRYDSAAVTASQYLDDGARIHSETVTWLPEKGRPVDRNEVANFVRILHYLFKLRHVAYDPRLFDVHAEMLDNEGVPMVEVPQSTDRMGPIVGNLYELLKLASAALDDGRPSPLTHAGGEEFRRQTLAAVPKHLPEGGFTLQKRPPKAPRRYRIDAPVSWSLSVAPMSRPKPPKRKLVGGLA